jgi:hypothetical protein
MVKQAKSIKWSMGMTIGALALSASSLLTISGCSSKLETGYDPTRLDMSLSQRRTLYADPFSKEAQDAQHETPGAAPSRRPGQY